MSDDSGKFADNIGVYVASGGYAFIGTQNIEGQKQLRPPNDLQSYLRSIATTYEKWWQLYTLTDIEGKQGQSKDVSPIFDFGLMVQTVPKEERKESQGENVERLSVLEGLRKYADSHVLLVGQPGSGKSTALARLLLEEATTIQDRIPVLVELRYWKGSIVQLFLDWFARHGLSLTVEQLETLLSRSLILFDGVNELPSEEARSQLSAFRHDHSKLPMIFTTRNLSLGGDLGVEKVLEMLPLRAAQMQSFIRAYASDQAEQMQRQLKDRLHELGQTPLLLWMLCEVIQQTSDDQLPSNLAGVFQAFTSIYEQSSVRKHEVALLKGDVRPLSDRRLWKKALKSLASAMMQGETPVDFRVVIYRDEAERELSKVFLNEQFPVRDILDDLLKYHLLQNRTVGQIEFRHQMIQEYYAAEALLEKLPSLSDAALSQEYLNYLKWTEPIALMLALVTEETQALRVVKLAIHDVDLILGARLAGEVKPVFQTITVGWIDALEIPLWAISQPEKATSGLPKTHEYNNGRTVSNRLSLSENAALAWDQILPKLKERIPGLLKALEDQSTTARESAAKTLGTIGSEQAIPGLLKALEDQSIAVRWEVAKALGRIGSEQAISGLLKALKDRGSYSDGGDDFYYPTKYFVRESAAEALGRIGSEQAISGLIKALEDQESESSVRKTVAEALCRIGSEQAIPGLLQALENQKPDVRKIAAEVLGRIGSEQAISGLIKALEDQKSESSVRKNVAEALCRIGSEQAIPGLLQALENQEPDVRESAAEVLGRIGSEEAVPGLLQALENQKPDVRKIAAEVLGRIGSEEAVPGLIKALKDHKLDVRKTVAEALGEIGSEEAIPSLLKALKDPMQDICESVAVVLKQSGFELEEVIPRFFKALEYPSPRYSVRCKAASALGQIGSEEAIPGLLKALKNPNLRESAAKALGQIGNSLPLACLWQLQLQQPTYALRDAIVAIQNRCKFYNHEIWQEAIRHEELNRG